MSKEVLSSLQIIIVLSIFYLIAGCSSIGFAQSAGTAPNTYAPDIWAGGYTELLAVGDRIMIRIGEGEHYITLSALDGAYATFDITGVVGQITLYTGVSTNLEVTGDSEFDFRLGLNSAENGKASVTVSSTQDTPPPQSTQEPDSEPASAPASAPAGESDAQPADSQPPANQLPATSVGDDLPLTEKTLLGLPFNTAIIIIGAVLFIAIIIGWILINNANQPHLPPEVLEKMRLANEGRGGSSSNPDSPGAKKPKLSELEKLGGKSIGLPDSLMVEYETGLEIPKTLIDYTQRMISAGYPENQIRDVLLNAGWNQRQIDTVFKYLKK